MKKIFLFLILVSGWSNYLLGAEGGEGGVQNSGGGFDEYINVPVQEGSPYLLEEQLGRTNSPAIFSSSLDNPTSDFASPTSDTTQSDLLFRTIKESIEKTLSSFKDADLGELRAELDKIPYDNLKTLDFSEKLDESTIKELEKKFVEILKSNKYKNDEIRNIYRKNDVEVLIRNLRQLVEGYNKKIPQEREAFLQGKLRELIRGSSNTLGPDGLLAYKIIACLVIGAIIGIVKLAKSK